MSRSSQIKLKPTNSCQLLLVLALFVSLQHQANSSGIFELNLSALQDSYGRDLRLDCCAWQNASQDKQHQMQLGSNLIQSATTQSVSNGLRYQAATAASGATETCDPTKCQLIVRICVKNYQTQIDPSQCTFGELTAQVMRPEPHQLRSQGSGSSNNHHHHSQQHPNHMSSLARLQQQQQLAAYQKMKGLNGAGSMMGQQQQQPANIHLQRMLQQQTAYQTTLGLTSSEQHARLYHQVPPSAQSRSLRQVAFDQPISFPFNFTWPGAFSLVIDAWYESPTGLQQLAGGPFSAQAYQSRLYHQAPSAGHHGGLQQQHQQQQQQQQHLATSYDLYKKQLIMQHSMHGWLTVKNEWTSGMHRNDAAQLVYSYRVTCQPNYYGEQCNILCRPRDDVYGHFVCSDQGDVMCLPGWQGKYCEDPICTPGCHKDQGNCTRPNECNCRYGWQGPACEQCVRYPGCVHGTCSKPHDCNCEEGWGGLLCNEDLRYCTNHQPCKNGATCRNKFDEETGEGTYVCICEEGFAGKNCERRVSALENNAQQSAASLQQQQQPSQQTQSNQTQSLTNWSSSNQMHGPGSSQLSVNSNGPTARGGNKFPAATTTTMAANKANQPASNNLLESRTPQPVPQQVLATAPNGASLDHRVMVAYGIIIVCMVILVVLLLLRFFFERLSGAVVSCGQRLVSSDSDGTIWSMISSASAGIGGQQQQHESGERRRSSSRRHRHHYHHRHLHHQSTRSLGLNANHEHDVATLQNHQNIYKSRSSLGTDKMAMVYGTNELCSASSTTSSSVSSSSAEDLADHHRALQAQYSASAHYGHLHPHHAHPHQPHQQQHQQHHHALSALNPSALYGSSVGALASHHHHLPLPPVHPVHSLHPHAHLNHHHQHHPADPYHAMAAHSVHNLSSATYQHLNERLSQQPPPPPYTISGSMLGNSQQRQSAAALASSIYNTHSTTYAPANSIYGGATYRHPASLILGPPLPAPNANSIYNTNEPTYGTAAALAAHCVSASNYSLGRSAPANSQQQQQRSEPQEAKSKAKGSSTSNNESGAGQQERDETANASSNSESDETTTTTTATAAAATTTATTASNPYGNLQQRAPTSERTDERPNEANERRAQSQQANFFTFDHN